MSTQGRIPKEFISQLLERCDIIEIISARVALIKRGNNFVACCPFHNEKTPSFSVSNTKQFYYCFGCHATGNAINFLMEFDRLSFVESVEMLSKQIGVEVPRANIMPTEPQEPADDRELIYSILENSAKIYQQQLKKHPEAKEYLQARGLNEDIIKTFGIGYAPQGWRNIEITLGPNPDTRRILLNTGMLVNKAHGQPYDRFRDRIMYPIHNRQGRVIAFGGRSLGNDTPKYLNSPESLIFHKGHELYGLFEAHESLRNAKKIIVVEGYMDVLALAQFGIRNVVATLGTSATEEHLQRLLRYSNEIIFCFDGDRAGLKAAWRALNNCLGVLQDSIQIKFIFLPENEDPDSLIRKEGVNAFINRIENATALSDYLFRHLSEQADLSTIDGKAQFCALIKPLIKKLSDSAFKFMLLQRVAQLLRVDMEKLPAMLGLELKQQGSTSSEPSHEGPLRMPSPTRVAITLLLQHPQLIDCITDTHGLNKNNEPGMDLLILMVELLKARPHINTAAILQHFSEHALSKALAKLATLELNIPESGLKNEFTDTLKRIEHQGLELQMEQLLNKANLVGLSDEERNQLKQLIADKHTKVY